MMMKNICRIILGGLCITLSATGCYYDNEEYLYPGSNTPVNCSSIQPTFSADVKPLILSKCAISGCHNAAGASGGVILETHGQISAKASRILTRAVVEKTMPPTGPLLPEESAKLKCWIEAGAPNN